MNYAVIIEPSPALDALVLERKRIATRSWPQAAYLTHPVHCTLVAGVFEEAARWIAGLSERLAALPAFTITCSTSTLFPNDPVTGGTTVAVSVEASTHLVALQRAVADVLAPFRDIVAAELLASRFSHDEPAASARTFGAPWVGAHWLPHFTIGSFPVAADDPALTPLCVPFTAMTVIVDRVRIWSVEGDAHTLRGSIALGGPRS